jgi:hypothetical protein
MKKNKFQISKPGEHFIYLLSIHYIDGSWSIVGAYPDENKARADGMKLQENYNDFKEKTKESIVKIIKQRFKVSKIRYYD